MGGGTDGKLYILLVVNFGWSSVNEKWNVNVWNRDDNQWNAGNSVFSATIIMEAKNTL
jgi:hypothetical protein